MVCDILYTTVHILNRTFIYYTNITIQYIILILLHQLYLL